MSYQPKTYRDEGGDRMTIADGGTIRAQSGGTLSTESGANVITADGVGTVGTASGLAVTEKGIEPVHKSVFALTDVNVVITNGSNAGHGAVKLLDFPDGAIAIQGGLVDLDVDVVGSALSATADGDVHVGTTEQTDVAVASIVATQHDIVATTAIAQLVAGEGPATAQDGVAATPLDGTATAKDAFLNFLFDTADISGDDAITVNGTVTLYWVNLGDYS